MIEVKPFDGPGGWEMPPQSLVDFPVTMEGCDDSAGRSGGSGQLGVLPPATVDGSFNSIDRPLEAACILLGR